MTTRDQVEALKIQAIDLLLKERHAIDEELKLLGYGQEKAPATYRRRGRPPKTASTSTNTTTDAIRAGDSSNELHGASHTPDTESDSR